MRGIFICLCVRRDRASCRAQQQANTSCNQYQSSPISFCTIVQQHVVCVARRRGQIVCFHWKAGSVPSPSFRRWHISEEKKNLMSIRVCQPQQLSDRARYFVPLCHFSAKISQNTQRKDKNIIMTAHQQVQLFSAYEGQHREQAYFPLSSSHHEQIFCS